MARDLDALQTQWKSHKYRKPTRGAIVLNHNLTKCLLVQGYPASTSWGFPKGKLERGESDEDCAIREVYEETGFDIRALIQGEQYLECQSQESERASRMYIIPGVPEETEFKPRVRKEIRDIAWFRVEDLPRHKKDLTTRQNLGKNPSSFFMIIPFISQLKKWISSHQKRKEHSSKKNSRAVSATFHNPTVQQRRASSSPSTRATGSLAAVSTQRNSPHTSPQSVPKRAVSRPIGKRTNTLVGVPVNYRGVEMHHPRMSVGVQHQPSPAMRSHSFPHTAVPLQTQIGYPLSPPRPPPPHHHHPPTLPQHPVIRTYAPVPRHVTLLPTPHSPHPPPNTSTPPAPSQYVPRPTSVFNPVMPPPIYPPNFNSPPTMKQVNPTSHLTPSPTTKFNPFTALGISTTSPTMKSKVTANPYPVSNPYQWNGSGTVFRPVQIRLQPAQLMVGFQFDKARILSVSYSS